MNKLRLVIPAAILLTITSCSQNNTADINKIGSYIAENASFDLTFPPSYENGEEVRVSCKKNDAGITLSITSPERSSGITVTAAAENQGYRTSVSVGDSFEIPLSPEAAHNLTETLLALFPAEYTTAASNDGDYRLIISDNGTVYTDINSVPQKISVGEREIIVSNFMQN